MMVLIRPLLIPPYLNLTAGKLASPQTSVGVRLGRLEKPETGIGTGMGTGSGTGTGNRNGTGTAM